MDLYPYRAQGAEAGKAALRKPTEASIDGSPPVIRQ